ncbi:MAG: thioesterase [bacterium]|nr:thioesterase [bacterium]
MPYIHAREFRIRHYECDAHGRLSPAVYLSYMQEAAFDASAAVGYSAARYEQLGLRWLAYETEIHYHHPLHYGDTITLKTWVRDFRRVRSLRDYEFYRDGVLVAQASTDWVLIDMKAMFPAAIPQDIINAYSQGDPAIPAPPRPPFPPMLPVPDHAFTLQRRVEWRDLDAAQHVNNAVYVHFALDAERMALRTAGWEAGQLQAEGVVFQPQQFQIEYKVAATLDDVLEITTWLADVDTSGGNRLFLIRRAADNKVLAKLRSRWQAIDAVSGHPAIMPATVYDALARSIP